MPASRLAPRTCLAVFLGGLASTSSLPVPAQDITPLKPVLVTGSRLGVLDPDGMSPATVISHADIEHSGQLGIASVLRQQVSNSVGSYTPTSGTGAMQGAAQINLRGIGAQRTLVLIDGRRLANDPALGGASQNINNIPLEMIDHVEILRDGASALYGSDAIGGVVNIIMRKNYTGLGLRAQLESADGDVGRGHDAALSGGLSNDSGHVYFGLESYDKDIIYSRDRPVLRDVTSAFGDPGTIYQYDAQGNIVPQASNPDANGNPRSFRPFDDCPASGFGTDPDHPDSATINGACRYHVGAVTGLTAALRRQSLSVGGDYLLRSNLIAFSRFETIHARSFGRFAAAPVDTVVTGVNGAGANGNVGIRIGADNPLNPNPGSTLVLNYRPVVLGTRDDTVTGKVHQFLLGLRGRPDLMRFKDWEVAFTFNHYAQTATGQHYGLISQLQAAVDSGTFDPFHPDPAAANSFRYTIGSDNHFKSIGLDGHINAEIRLGELTLPLIAGLEYQHDDFAVVSDAQSSQSISFSGDGSVAGFQQSNVFGATGGSARGARSHEAAFAETSSELFEKKLKLSLALRWDQYSDVGGTPSPKLSAMFQPTRQWLLRAGYGHGFRAPDLAALHGAPTKASALIIDRVACRDNPGDPDACGSSVRTAINDSNPLLRPETSRNLTLGTVFNPTPSFAVSLDYYAIKIKHAITQLTPQTVFDNELRCLDAGRPCDARYEGYVVRNPAGGLLFVYSPAVNAANLETDGIDLAANYTLPTKHHGTYKLSAGLARVLSYKRKDTDSAPLLERLDTLSASGEIFPKYRAQAALNWTLGRFNAALVGHYISAVSDCDAPDKAAHRPACRNKFGDYFTADLQLGLETRWNQSIAIGLRNLFNQAPRVSQYARSIGVPGVFLALHDSEQRVMYLRVSQRF